MRKKNKKSIWAHKRKPNMESKPMKNYINWENKNIINHIKAQRLSWFGHYKGCQILEKLRRYFIRNF